MAVCVRCSETKPLDDYYKTPGGRRRTCRDCIKSRQRERHANNRLLLNEQSYWRRVRREYGIGQRKAMSIYQSQNGQCAICRTDLDPPGKSPNTHIDHCHIDGTVRGVLCFKCNVGVGRFNDDPQLLDAAADYLRRAK